jgi:SHS2 domain-containing protein
LKEFCKGAIWYSVFIETSAITTSQTRQILIQSCDSVNILVSLLGDELVNAKRHGALAFAADAAKRGAASYAPNPIHVIPNTAFVAC